MASARHVIVAGAGIAGLTAALAMTRAGLRVTLLEQSEKLEETGAGIQLSPNATRVLIALGEIQAKLAAAYAGFLRRFDAAGAHNADGYGSSSAWLAARAQLTRNDARSAVRRMHQLGDRKHLAEALAAGGLTGSWAAAITGWTKKLPADVRDETDRIRRLIKKANTPRTLHHVVNRSPIQPI